MIVSHEHRLIFVKTRKTAGTSVEVLLARLLGDGAIVTPISPAAASHVPRNFGPPRWTLSSARTRRTAEGRRDLGRGLWYYNHMPARLIRQRLGRRVWDSYFKFCFERDPWDKTVSWYYYRTSDDAKPVGFAEFVRSGDLPVDWNLYTLKDSVAVDMVGRYENLDSDLRAALSEVGLSVDGGLTFEKAGLRPRTASVDDMYDAATSALVGEAFRRESQLFGYRAPVPRGDGSRQR